MIWLDHVVMKSSERWSRSSMTGIYFIFIVFIWTYISYITCHDQISAEVESQFNHRKVNFKRSKDVRAVYQMIEEMGRYLIKMTAMNWSRDDFTIKTMNKMREAAKNGTNRRLNDTAAHLQDLNHQSRMQLVHIGRYIIVWRGKHYPYGDWCWVQELCSVHVSRFCIPCNYIEPT